MTSEAKAAVLTALVDDLSNELRFRGEAQFVYSAATVAGFGGTTWGAAALNPNHPTPIWASVVGIALLAAIVIWKIFHDHDLYKTAKLARAEVAQKLREIYPDVIPTTLLNEKAGYGYLWSIGIVVAAAAGSMSFCLAKIAAGMC